MIRRREIGCLLFTVILSGCGNSISPWQLVGATDSRTGERTTKVLLRQEGLEFSFECFNANLDRRAEPFYGYRFKAFDSYRPFKIDGGSANYFSEGRMVVNGKVYNANFYFDDVAISGRTPRNVLAGELAGMFKPASIIAGKNTPIVAGGFSVSCSSLKRPVPLEELIFDLIYNSGEVAVVHVPPEVLAALNCPSAC